MTEKYIVVGTFNVADPGTLTQPYRATTADDFDFIMRRLADPPNLGQAFHVHLGAGTFYTRGQRHTPGVGLSSSGTAGWDLRSDWTISGSGEAATTIVLQQWPDVPAPTELGSFLRFGVLASHDAQEYFVVSNVAIENLSVDGRWNSLANKPATPLAALAGLHLYVKGAIIYRNVTTTGMSGNEGAPITNPQA